jgi:hypothetical protein
MKLTATEIASTVRRNCSRGLDAKTVDRVVGLWALAAKREFEFFPNGSRASFQKTVVQAKELSQKFRELATESEVQGLGINREYLVSEEQRLNAHGEHLRDVLRKYGRPDHDEGLWVVVSNVLEDKPDFKNWKALARMGAITYRLAGRKKDAEHVTAGNLARIAKQLREVPRRSVQELLARARRFI